MRLLRKNQNSLRVRFALGFGVLFTFFLALALLFIYVSFTNFRKAEFYERLRDKALTTFRLLIEVEQIDHDLLKVIDKNTLNNLYDEKVVIFKDTALIYKSIDDVKIQYVPELFTKAKEKKEFFTSQGHYEVVALHIEQDTDQYIILASAYDKYGRRITSFLKWVMITVYCLGLVLGWVATYLLVKKVIQPLDVLKAKLKNINYSNLYTRLPEKGQGEEVNSLSINFNQMLGRLEQSVGFQKDFIHYASHELRTPLAAMVSLTENSLVTDRSIDEYKETLKKLFQQQKNLTDVTNSLLLLSDDTSASMSQEYPHVRLDELVFKSVEITKSLYPNANIDVSLEGNLSNENSLLINANEPLMLMAFNNLLKNALQYSLEKKVSVVVSISEKEKRVQFLNPGTSLSAEEEEKIFTPFYRGANAIAVKGYGLGLPFVKQIVQVHGGRVHYSYNQSLNVFTIAFQQ